MKLMDFLSKKSIVAEIKSTKKEDVLRELVDLLINAGELERSSRNKVIDALLRESRLALPP